MHRRQVYSTSRNHADGRKMAGNYSVITTFTRALCTPREQTEAHAEASPGFVHLLGKQA